MEKYRLLSNNIDNVQLMPIDDSNMDDIINYDASIIGYKREQLLKLSLREPGVFSMAAFNSKDGRVLGYSCFRTNNCNKAMPTPIYADEDTIAECLIYHSIQSFPLALESGLVLLVIDSNPGAIKIAEKLDLEKHETVPRLFTQKIPEADYDRIYCLLSPDFSPI